MLIYQHEQCIISDDATRYETIITFFSEISQQTLNIYEKLAIVSQMWQRGKFYFTHISSPWYMIKVPNVKEILPAIMEECMRMDSQTVGTD